MKSQTRNRKYPFRTYDCVDPCWHCQHRLYSPESPIRACGSSAMVAGGTMSLGRETFMNIEVSRRHFMKLAGPVRRGRRLAAFGFGGAEEAQVAAIRPFKLAKTTETRNTCPYCSVACGIIMYSKGDADEGRARRDRPHRGRSGPPDQPRHALPEGRGAARLREGARRAPRSRMIRKPGTDKFERDHLGRRARPHRAADEGRPRQELRRHERATA